MVGTFNTAKDDDPIANGVRKIIGSSEQFWVSEEDRYFSLEALKKGAHIVELVMTREQFDKLLGLD